MKHPLITEALLNLRSGAQFTLSDDDLDTLVKHSEFETPSEDEMNSEIQRIEKNILDNQYRLDRVTGTEGYASIGDQLDMMYKDKLNSTTTWTDHVKAIKDRFPKQ